MVLYLVFHLQQQLVLIKLKDFINIFLDNKLVGKKKTKCRKFINLFNITLLIFIVLDGEDDFDILP